MLNGRGERSVLVHLGYYNKIPYPEWFKNNRNLFLTALEAGTLRSRHWHYWVRALFWAADCQLLTVSSRGRKKELASPLVSSYKGTNLTQEGSTLKT